MDREKYAAVSVMSSSTAIKAKYLKSADEIILAMDNDQAGKVARDKAGKAIGKCRSVCWTEADPKDMNDLLKAGKEDRIRELVEDAEEFEAPKPDLTETAGCDPDKPTINPGKMQLPGTLAETWAAIEKYNNPPRIFRTEVGSLVLIAPADVYTTRPVDKVLMREFLAESANWTKTVYGNDLPDIPPSVVVDSILAHPEKFPLLKKIIPCPVFSEKGKLHTQKGYDEETGFFLPENIDLSFNRMPIKTAREILFDWLVDFPFDSEASRANAIAAAVTPFVRAIVGENPMPRMFFTAPVAATGKGKLANVLALPFTGKDLVLKTECRNEEELEKAIVSEFMEKTPDYIFFDNLTKTINSGKLAAWATTYRASGRVLGSSQSVTFPVNAPVWLMTANNPDLDRDNARRSLNIRIDAGMERPETRTKYKHPKIEKFTLAHRQEIISALLSVCAEWIEAARPEPVDVTAIGSFEEWRFVVGGVLEYAGINGLAGNMNQFIENSDSDTESFKGLLELITPEKKYKAGSLVEIITTNKLSLPDESRKMGRLLTKRKDQVFCIKGVNYKLVRPGKVDGSWSWAIIPCEENNKGLLFQNEEPLENNLSETEVKQTDKGLRGYGVPTEYQAVTIQHDPHNTYNNAHNTYAGESIGNTCKPLTPLSADIIGESGRGTTRAFIVSPSPEECCGECEDENIIWDGSSPVCAATGLQIEGGIAYAHCPKLKNKQKDKEDAC